MSFIEAKAKAREVTSKGSNPCDLVRLIPFLDAA